MNKLCKSTTELLVEAANMPTDSKYMSNADVELFAKISHIIELDEPFTYIIQSIPVIKESTIAGDRYFVEYDMLNKYMESNRVTDVLEAMTSLCEANEINLQDTILVFESKKDMVDKIKKMDKVDVNKTNKSLKEIQEKGINVACKKSGK